MRGKTRNLLENIGAFSILILILFGIFYFIANYTDLGNSLELDKFSQETISKIKQEENNIVTKEIIPEEIIQEKKAQKEEKLQKEEVTKRNTSKEIKKEEKKSSKTIEDKKEQKLPKVKTQEKIEKAKKQEIEVIKKTEEKKQETKPSAEPKIQKEQSTAPKKVLSAKNLEKFSLINKFIRATKNKINDKVKRLGVAKSAKQRYANIRITVLKDGSYEQLKLMHGDKEYFNLIKAGILSSFPLTINKQIDDQFPRYFRMKIIEEK